jgi:formylglycine-generating enzyme required for sulfatase activity
LDGDRPKLTDFDLVRAVDSTGGTQTQGHLGTFLYSAPEVLENAKDAEATADVYSLAMTAVFSFHGRDLPADVWRRPEAFVEKLACPAAARAALRRGISWEPEERPASIAELCRELCRPAAGHVTARADEPKPGEEWINEKDGSVLVYVPGGEYALGEGSGRHRVILSPFWIGKYPVTNEQYGRFLKVNPKAKKLEYWDDQRFNQPQHPVVGVSWDEAKAYCAWASLQLPSEARWEAAARGTDERRFPWGNAEPAPEHASFDRQDGTTPVGAFPKGAGPFGTLDQAGNVWEWCEDVWNADAYKERDGKEDPDATIDDAAVRCLRGGSWNYPAGTLAAAYRHGFGASDRSGSVGFRCSLPSRPEPSPP